MSLRAKLLLVGLVILTLPVAGWQTVRETERFLRQSQERSVRAAAASVAAAMSAGPEWAATEGIYVRRLESPVILDGYGTEWEPWEDQALVIEGTVRLMAAQDARHLYLLVSVSDDDVLYAARPDSADADHLVLNLGQRRHVVTTTAPGWVASPLSGGADAVRGEWQDSAGGYTVELRIPLAEVRGGLGLAVADVDRRGRSPVRIGTGPPEEPARVVSLVTADPRAEELLAAVAPPAARVWLLNGGGWVLAMVDGREPGPAARTGARERWLRTLIYRNLLASPMAPGRLRDGRSIRLQGPEVDAALAGETVLRWESAPDNETVYTIAAAPVRRHGAVVGSVILEQSGDALLLSANEALLNLLGLTLAAFALTGLVLFSYASVLVFRIRRLHRAVSGAAADNRGPGQAFPSSRAGDELGALHRAFGEMLRRLHQHTDYLETLTRKLSHELRTPLAVMRSSLDNLEEGNLDPEQRGYAARAREGAERLATMVQAMTEASRLEQLMETAESEAFSLKAVVEGCVAGYAEVYPDRRFRVELPDDECTLVGVPELIAQLLDKLVDNAVDFSPPGGWIAVRLAPGARHHVLGVSNQGPPLPEAIRANLFDSLVSLRGDRKAERPHLGLGLYLVRIVAEGHGGEVSAHDLPEGRGVEFRVRLPAARKSNEPQGF